MGQIQQNLLAQFRAAVGQRFGYETVNKGAAAMGAEAIAIMQVRILNGLDYNGAQFTPLTKRYQTWKKRFIRGAVKFGSRGGRVPTFYKWKATGLPNFMRLTGALFDDMKVEVPAPTKFVGNNLKIPFRIYIDKRSAKKAEGLMKKRKFFGIAKGRLRAQESAKLIAAFKRSTKLSGTGFVR